MPNYSISITLGSFAGETLPILLGKSPSMFSQTQGPFAHLSWNIYSFIAETPGQALAVFKNTCTIFCKMKEIKDRPKK